MAREVRRVLRLHEQVSVSLALFHVARLDWVSARAWNSPDVQASVSTDGVQEVLTFTAQPGEDESDFTGRVLRDLDARRMPARR